MQIIIDGKEAVLKQGSSFDFIAENRLFSGSDSFTLTITFPLKDCLQNLDIFGHINRSELAINDYVFDCEIRDRAFSRFGTLTITEISDIDLKAQFLEGRAEQNFSNKFDDAYINDLKIGNLGVGSPSSTAPERVWNPATSDYFVYPGHCYVALPWVSADSGITHNFADYDSVSGKYSWSEDTKDITYMPYLLYLTARICQAVGYKWDFKEWEEHPWLRDILVCNVLPGSWDFNNYARALPRWTVAEYFEKLELFLRGEFAIDHKSKSVSFRFSSSVLSEIVPVVLDKVVDEFSTSVKPDGSDCEYLEAQSRTYKDADHQLSNYYSCPWFVGYIRESDVTECTSVSSLVGSHQDYLRYGISDWAPGTSAYKDPELEKVFHVSGQDLYFMLRHAMRTPASGNNRPIDYYDMQPLNMFGPSGDISNESSIELEFVPACIDYTEPKYGKALFVSFGSYSEDYDDSEYRKSTLQRTLEDGEKSDTPEYFSMIYIAYYDGSYRNGVLPHPEVCDIILDPYQVNIGGRLPFNLRLNDPDNTLHAPVYRIDRTRKVTFKFLSEDIPNPRALFFIHGRRYICEKITATFTEDGMSQLLKGEFWPLLDD